MPLLSVPRLPTLLSATLLSACSDLGYYAHLVRGQYALLDARRPIAAVLADPATDAQLRAHLELARAARAFASDRLDLPRNGSYTDYADLRRPYAVWNVFATPEFSLEPVRHCFPVAGCVAYRGYYEQTRAEEEAGRLRAEGDDTYVGGVPAYSTLGWFDDPILNTMLRYGDDALAGTVFHELAHQKLYVKNDTMFNESFASFVEREGLRQWREQRGATAQDDVAQDRTEQFTRLVLDAREQLRRLYASGLAPEAMRAKKTEEIEHLRAEYRRLRNGAWQGYGGFDGWVDGPINNAKLLPFGLYHRWVPAFAALYEQQHRDWPAFFAAARKLAREDATERTRMLDDLLASNSTAPPPDPRSAQDAGGR
jgi:predicted aminopeptidase